MPQILILGIISAVGLLLLFIPESASASIAPSESNDLNNPSWGIMNDNNVTAFLRLITKAESRGDYHAIAGGDSFSDFSEHPFVLDPTRNKPLGTTASGAYQMVKGTWVAARDALGLTDFSPASQDAAAIWILKVKRSGAYDLILAGNFDAAMTKLAPEWEAFSKMIDGSYPISYDQARDYYVSNGGNLA